MRQQLAGARPNALGSGAWLVETAAERVSVGDLHHRRMPPAALRRLGQVSAADCPMQHPR